MADKNEKATEHKNLVEKNGFTREDRGLLSTVATAGGELAVRSADAAFGALRDVHGELFVRTSSAIDFVDEAQQGALGVVRKVVARVDHLTLALLQAAEAVTGSAVRAGRTTSDAVVDVATRSGEAVVGGTAAKRAAA